MNERRERFCQEYVVDLNATQAYILVGYSKSGAAQSAVKLLRNPQVIKRIEELQEKIREDNQITLKNVVAELIADREGARQQKNYSAAIKANVEIAKLHGMYAVDNSQNNPHGHLSTEDLFRKINRICKTMYYRIPFPELEEKYPEQ